MKKFLTSFAVAVLVFTFSVCALADSPLTSAPFYKAYLDEPIVDHAQYMWSVDLDIAEYLTDDSNPIDVKAAIINAMRCGIEDEEALTANKTNYESYMAYHALRRGFPLDGMEMDEHFGPDDVFSFGYLKATDNISKPDKGLEILGDVPGYEMMAEMEWDTPPDRISGGVTYNLVTALVEAETLYEKSPCEAWKLVRDTASDNSLEQDMRPEAVDIIMDYMRKYEKACK